MSETIQPTENTPVVETPVEKTVEQPSKYKVKVDGNEMDVALEELITSYQTRSASDKRFNEAAKMRKEIDSLIEAVEKDPFAIHKLKGIDARKAAEELLLAEIQKEEEASRLTPEQKEIRELKQMIQELISPKKEEVKPEVKEEIDDTEEINSIDEEIFNTFKELGIEKPSPRMLAFIATEMLMDYQAAKKRIPAKEAYERFDKSSKSYLEELADSYSGDNFTDKLPKKVVDKIIQEYINTRKGKEIVQPKKNSQEKTNELEDKLNSFFKSKKGI